MTNKEILEKAISKAIDGGWQGVANFETGKLHFYPDANDLLNVWEWENDSRVFSDGACDDYESINVEAIIFNHDFAKALWHQKAIYNDRSLAMGVDDLPITLWQHHLQQMVISEDPIKYLGDNL